MSRKRRRIAEAKKAELKVPAFKGSTICIVVAIVLAGIPFALGKYIEFNSPGPFDSAANVYSAKHFLDGAKMGVDEVSSAQPATLLVNVLGVALFGFSETGPKLIQMLLQLGALVLMFYTVRRVFGSLAAVVSVAVASIYLSAPVIAKFGNVKEQYMITFMVISACCLILREIGGGWWLLVVSGAAAMNAFYFKATGCSVLVAVGVYLVAQPILRHGTWRRCLFDFLLLIGGAVIGVLPTAFFFLWQGQLPMLLSTLPFLAVKLFVPIIVTIVVMVVVAIVIVRVCIHVRLVEHLKQVRPLIWISGGTAIAVVLTFYLIRFSRTDDAISYLEDISFIRFFLILKSRIVLAVWDLRLAARSYVGASREMSDFSELKSIVMRYYGVLILPVALASGALLLRIVRRVFAVWSKGKFETECERLVLFLAAWWILDMAFVWISPRSYEQYYLPLNASAAMLGGYVFWFFGLKLSGSQNKPAWYGGLAAAFLCMVIMSWKIFFGLTTSPFSGTKYPEPRRGYAQRFAEASKWRRGEVRGQWEAAGDHIRQRSDEDDTIFVWGWVPGIYVRAQRLSSAPQAFESEMHVKSPEELSADVEAILGGFAEEAPKFIVDSRKQHFPWGATRPLELWPYMDPRMFGLEKGRFLTPDAASVAQHDAVYKKILERISGADEVRRYEAMSPLREYVMNNYRIVSTFGQHVLFERKAPVGGSGPAR